MGVAGHDKATWQTGDLSFEIVILLLEQLVAILAHDNANVPQEPRRRLKVAIDANLLAHKYLHDRSPFQPDGAVINVARAFSESLIDVHIVCDHPTERHPSKRASCQRRAQYEKKKIQVITARAKLQSMLGGSGNVENATTICEAQKKIKSLESAVKRQQLPSCFSSKLEDFVSTFSPGEEGVISFEKALTQADPTIARMALTGEIDFTISGDSDFSMYIGPNGRRGLGDIMLKDVKLSTRNGRIVSCKVSTGQQTAADAIEATLNPKLGRSPFKLLKNGRVPEYFIGSRMRCKPRWSFRLRSKGSFTSPKTTLPPIR
jgi:hypothetical protein